MSPRNATRILLPALAMAILAAGCGKSQDQADLANGKKLFVGKGTCGSCHALARAGTQGKQGPDLDDAFGPSRSDGFTKETVQGVVQSQIANVRRGSIMKPDLVKGDDARDVAAYIAYAAGQGGKDGGLLATVGAPQNNKPIAAEGGTLEMPANPEGQLAFASTQATAPPGKLKINMANPSPIQHNIAIEELKAIGPVVGKGGNSAIDVMVAGKKYEYVCTVPGHAEGGMKGTLTVK